MAAGSALATRDQVSSSERQGHLAVIDAPGAILRRRVVLTPAATGEHRPVRRTWWRWSEFPSLLAVFQISVSGCALIFPTEFQTRTMKKARLRESA